MNHSCENCKYYDYCVVPIGYNRDKCNMYEPQKPMTNADHIRAMNDEQLAEFLDKIATCCNEKALDNGIDGLEMCKICPVYGCNCHMEKDGFVEWLQQPRKVEEDV